MRGSKFGGNVDLDCVFESLDDFASQCREPAEDVDRAALDAFFVDEGDVAILHLDRDGTSTVSLVTFTKSERTSKGIGLRMTFELTSSVRSVNLILGACCSLANCSRRSNSLLCRFVLSGPRPSRSMPPPLKRCALFAMPICSQMVRPALGVISEGIFFGAVHGHVIFAAHAGVDEFDDDFLADAFNVAVAPCFEGEGRGLAAAFFHGALVGAARGMGLNFIGLAEDDVDAAAIGLPSGNAGGEMLVGIGNALVVLFFIFVLFGVGRGIAALPEGFNEVVALLVVGELLEGGALFVGDDVGDVLGQPLLVGLAQFLLEGALASSCAVFSSAGRFRGSTASRCAWWQPLSRCSDCRSLGVLGLVLGWS